MADRGGEERRGREDVRLSHGVALVLIQDEKGIGIRMLDVDRRTYLTPRLPLEHEDVERLASPSPDPRGEAVTFERGEGRPPLTVFVDESALIVSQSAFGSAGAFREAARRLMDRER